MLPTSASLLARSGVGARSWQLRQFAPRLPLLSRAAWQARAANRGRHGRAVVRAAQHPQQEGSPGWAEPGGSGGLGEPSLLGEAAAGASGEPGGTDRPTRLEALTEIERVKEMQRRKRISDANRGRTPWNKGRRHSPETIAKIRAGTTKAMARPEVRAKLEAFNENMRRPHDEETKAKIRRVLQERSRTTREVIKAQCLIVIERMRVSEDERMQQAAEFPGTLDILCSLAWSFLKKDWEQLSTRWEENFEFRERALVKIRSRMLKTSEGSRPKVKNKVKVAVDTFEKLKEARQRMEQAEAAVAKLQQVKAALAGDPDRLQLAIAAEQRAGEIRSNLRLQVEKLTKAMGPLAQYLSMDSMDKVDAPLGAQQEQQPVEQQQLSVQQQQEEGPPAVAGPAVPEPEASQQAQLQAQQEAAQPAGTEVAGKQLAPVEEAAVEQVEAAAALAEPANQEEAAADATSNADAVAAGATAAAAAEPTGHAAQPAPGPASSQGPTDAEESEEEEQQLRRRALYSWRDASQIPAFTQPMAAQPSAPAAGPNSGPPPSGGAQAKGAAPGPVNGTVNGTAAGQHHGGGAAPFQSMPSPLVQRRQQQQQQHPQSGGGGGSVSMYQISHGALVDEGARGSSNGSSAVGWRGPGVAATAAQLDASKVVAVGASASTDPALLPRTFSLRSPSPDSPAPRLRLRAVSAAAPAAPTPLSAAAAIRSRLGRGQGQGQGEAPAQPPGAATAVLVEPEVLLPAAADLAAAEQGPEQQQATAKRRGRPKKLPAEAGAGAEAQGVLQEVGGAWGTAAAAGAAVNGSGPWPATAALPLASHEEVLVVAARIREAAQGRPVSSPLAAAEQAQHVEQPGLGGMAAVAAAAVGAAGDAAAEAAPRRRGRPRKAAQDQQPQQQPPPQQQPQQQQQLEQQPGGAPPAGRPAGWALAADPQARPANVAAPEAPRRRGRPPKPAAPEGERLLQQVHEVQQAQQGGEMLGGALPAAWPAGGASALNGSSSRRAPGREPAPAPRLPQPGQGQLTASPQQAALLGARPRPAAPADSASVVQEASRQLRSRQLTGRSGDEEAAARWQQGPAVPSLPAGATQRLPWQK